LLARKGNNFFLLARLFAKGHRYFLPKKLEEDFVDWRTKELIGGRTYPGLILPLELGRDHHEQEFLQYGKPQSAKLLVKRDEDGQDEFYSHIAFEFSPEPITPETILGIDRGAAKIGSGTVIGRSGEVIADKIQLEGKAFSEEMARLRKRIAEHQRKGRGRHRLLRLRGRKADIAIGEYANRVVAEALKHRSQIVLEKIKGTTMALFLTQSQFQKLHQALTYKAERVGLPPPVEVPAAYTSQTCARCGHQAPENRPKRDAAGRSLQGVFRCISCGYEANADDNASEVIALRALHQGLHGGKFQKFNVFRSWLRELRAGTA